MIAAQNGAAALTGDFARGRSDAATLNVCHNPSMQDQRKL
jgi:hypothetical protein